MKHSTTKVTKHYLAVRIVSAAKIYLSVAGLLQLKRVTDHYSILFSRYTIARLQYYSFLSVYPYLVLQHSTLV